MRDEEKKRELLVLTLNLDSEKNESSADAARIGTRRIRHHLSYNVNLHKKNSYNLRDSIGVSRFLSEYESFHRN